MHVRVKMTDTAPSLLNNVLRHLPTQRAGSRKQIGALASKAVISIKQRTSEGKGESGQPFGQYKTEKYYAPVENRPPGYPQPTGGAATKTGKSMKYDSYSAYKSAMGFGAAPQLGVSWQMLNDIIWVVRSKVKALLFFASRLSAAKAHRHHTGFYPFFGIEDNSTEQAINDELRKQFKDARKKAMSALKKRRTRSK